MENQQDMSEYFDQLDDNISQLAASARQGATLNEVLAGGKKLVAELLTYYATAHGKPMPATDDLLELFKGFVKGEPSLNTVRDNVRELVFYQNCIDSGREDALPPNPAIMVAHTTRHIYFYLKSRSEQES